MNDIISQLNNIQSYVIIGVITILIVLLIIILAMLKSLNRLEAKYRKLTRGINNKNLEQIVIDYLDNIDKVKEESNIIKDKQQELSDQLKGCIQKVAVLRYKAFEDIGSDLSFSIALLDNNNDGIILTGIYGREDSTVYAKPIEKGISRYDLSEEEKEALSEAANKSN